MLGNVALIYWCLAPLQYDQFYFFLWPRTISINKGFMECSLPKKVLIFQDTRNSRVHPIPHNLCWRLTFYPLIKSFSSFTVHFKYHLISQSYTKVILLCSQSIDYTLLKLSHHIVKICSHQISVESRVGSMSYFLIHQSQAQWPTE